MRVMVIVKTYKETEAGVRPDASVLAAASQFNEELVKAGVMLAAEGLHPSSSGIRIRFAGGTRTVTEGPFSETTDHVIGFWLWQVKSLDEAIEWAKRGPTPVAGAETEIEIRQVFEADQFADELTSGLADRESRSIKLAAK